MVVLVGGGGAPLLQAALLSVSHSCGGCRRCCRGSRIRCTLRGTPTDLARRPHFGVTVKHSNTDTTSPHPPHPLTPSHLLTLWRTHPTDNTNLISSSNVTHGSGTRAEVGMASWDRVLSPLRRRQSSRASPLFLPGQRRISRGVPFISSSQLGFVQLSLLSLFFSAKV